MTALRARAPGAAQLDHGQTLFLTRSPAVTIEVAFGQVGDHATLS